MGIYSNLEDKWYGLIDKIDEIVPISGTIDKIDEVVPSFTIVLAIILIFILLTAIGFFITITNFEIVNQKEIIVLSEDNIPINNVALMIDGYCADGVFSTTTNSSGKANVNVCSEEIVIRATKKGYEQYNQTITQSEDQIIIKLKTASAFFGPRILTIQVQDNQQQNINSATIELTCLGQTNSYQNQPTEGWQIEIPSDCQNPQIRAEAQSFDQKTVILNPSDQRKVITLEKTILQGTAYFETSTPKGPEQTNITITNQYGQTNTTTTNLQGTSNINLNSGKYNYTATSTIGEIKQGTFQLEPNQKKLIEIEFENSPDEAKPVEERDYIAIKLIDEHDAPISFADITIVQEDGNILLPIRKTNTNGKTTPQPILDSNQNFKAIASSSTYQTKIFNVVLQKQNQFQEIKLTKGGSKLTINTQNDINNPEPRALIILTHPELPNTPIKTGNTNTQAIFVIDNLPPANYKLFATDQTERDEANKNIIITQNQDKNITLTLTTGTGNIRYNFFDTQKNPTDVQIKTYEKETQPISIFQGETTRNNYLTPTIKRNNQIIIETTDQNFIPHTTIPYRVSRGTTQKEVFLTKQSQLPNNNPIQLLLEQAYTSNPINSNMSRTTHATNIQQNTTYWLYFTLVLNNENQGTAIANFYTNDNNFLINNIYSINGANLVMVNQKEETIIEQNANQNITNQKAVQANARLTNIQAPKAIPIILEIKTDQNATNLSINFEAIHVNNETQGIISSLEYERNLIVGEGVCFSDCPPFFFNNYLKWIREDNETETRPINPHPAENILLIGDDYELITNITNLTDIDFETINIENTIPQTQISRLALNNDQNQLTKQTNLLPLSKSQNTNVQLIPKDNGVITLTQNITSQKITNLQGTTNNIRFNTTTKKQIIINTSPQTLSEKTNYPLFIIQTTYDNVRQAKTNYRILINNQQIDNGQTDANGIAITSLDLTNFDKGDIIQIYANDDEGSLGGYLEKTIIEKYEQPIQEEPCIEINAQKVTTLNKGQTTEMTINSTCGQQKTIFLHTDLSTSQKTIQLEPQTNQAITITATPRGELLGAYPLQVILIDGSRYQQLKHMDIIIKDPSSTFDLENAIFDLTTLNQMESYITNTQYTTRKNNFYPEMRINTNTVTLDYDKPGIPDEFTFEAVVTGFGIESTAYGMIVSNIAHARQRRGSSCGGSGCRMPKDVPTTPESPTDAVKQIMQNLCERMVDDGETFPKPNPPLDESGLITILPEFIDYESGIILPPEGISNIITEVENYNPNPELDRVTTTAQVDDFEEQLFFQENHTTTPRDKEETGRVSTATPSVPSENINISVGESRVMAGGGEPAGELNDSPRTFPSRDYIIEYHWDFLSDVYGNITGGMPRPPEFGEVWAGIHEPYGDKLFTPLRIDNPSKRKAQVLHATYFGGGEYYVMYHLQGKKETNWTNVGIGALVGGALVFIPGVGWWALGSAAAGGIIGSFIYDDETARIIGQIENPRASEFLDKRIGTWSETVTIPTTQGIATPVGNYIMDATPLPKGTNEETVHGHSPGTSWSAGNTLFTAGCVIPNGFVAPERAVTAEPAEGFEPFVLPSADHPHVEYDPSGLIGYTIPRDSFPKDLKVFLYDGQYWAEYIGVPSMNDAQINFTITKNNLMGVEYAILEVFDWVGDEIKKQSFQIKLQSEETTCISSQGDIGYTGPEFVPRLLFNWDWDNMPANQCDKDNPNHTYCDATQFTITLLKRLEIIENLLNNGQLAQIPILLSYDAMLIKDTYNQNFLNDFDEHYSKPLNSAPIYQDKLAYYLKENKLEINSNMQFGGIYNITIRIPNLGTTTNTLFDDDGKPVEKITIEITPVQQAPNYSPFYELPFNGPIGQNGREGYGVVANTQIKLDDTIPLVTSGSGSTTLNIDTTQTGLNEMQKGVLLNYNKDEQFIFSQIQPNPVIWNIESQNGKINTSYKIDQTNNINQTNWTLLGSNMGTNICQDFERNTNNLFTATKSGENFNLSWDGRQAGILNLGTIIFTPQNTQTQIIPDSQTQMKGQPTTQTHNNVILGYYDSIQKEDYTHLKGLFETIKNRETCISTTPETTKIFYNPEYLSRLLTNTDPQSNTCGFETSIPFFSTISTQ